jgi:hypothetical protein
MSNVIPIIPCLDPDHVLKTAIGEYKEVLLIGWNDDGELCVRHGGEATLQDAYYKAALFCHKVLSGDYA